MRHEPDKRAERKARIFIIAVSVGIPLVVALLYLLPKAEAVPAGLRAVLNQLPLFNATVNGCTALILLVAFVAIRKKNVPLHRLLMTTALVLSGLFLVSYIAYHLTTPSAHYGGEGTMKYVYYFILLTHILLSAAIVPLVLISYTRALAHRFDRHRRIARITWPLWLYVAITGVLVYVLISPYYAH